MGFGGLRSIIRPLSRTLLSRASTSSPSSFPSPPYSKPEFRFPLGGGFFQSQSPLTQFSRNFSIFDETNSFDSLTDKRFPKRRPLDKPRRKRASLRPSGPIAWLKHEPGQPLLPNNPNQGSVKRRNEKKRMRLHRAFVQSEAKKRKAEIQEAKRKKNIKKVERKMAAVARERAWAARLAELQQLEKEKTKSMA